LTIETNLAAVTAPSGSRAMPYGNLGSHVAEALTWADAVEMADLNWDPVERPLLYRFGGSGGGAYRRIEDRKAIVRSDTGAFLGDVGINYQPVPNLSAGAFLTPIVESGAGKFLRAGHLGGGRVIFGVVQLGEDVTLDLPANGDPYVETFRPLLVMMSAHDGTCQVRASIVVMRLVCTNGLTLPVMARHYFVRHTGNVEAKLEAAEEAIGMWTTYRAKFETTAARLIAKKMSWQDIEAFTRKLFPSKREADGDEAAKQTTERREALLAVLRQAPDLARVNTTGWGVYNAVAEYVDHVQPYSDGRRTTGAERRFISMVDGDNGPAALKDRAYALLTR
jgi:phage/plasmid-like protein (TIGR03299 family)